METRIPWLLFLFLLFSCQKENKTVSSPNESSFDLTAIQQEEITHLKHELKFKKNQFEKSVSPGSDENYMDIYGLVFQNALVRANELNAIYNEQLSPESALEKWSSDLNTSYQEGINHIPVKRNENITFSDFAKTIHDLYLDDFENAINHNQLISHSKIFERFIDETELLSTDEKDALFMEIAILKYSIYSMYEFGTVINGTDASQGFSKSQLWNCIGKKVRQIHQDLGNTAGFLFCQAFLDIIILNCVSYLLLNE